MRNRAVARAVAVWAVATLAIALVAVATGAAPVLPWVIAGSLAAGIPLIILTARRYHAIAELAARVDDVLHGERTLEFSHMEEGELSVLASELDKMRSRLTITAEELDRERMTLADALADISHQIKTPLTSLSITTELVRKELARRGDAPEEVERLRRIERLQVRVEDLVATLLKLARLDAGTLAFTHEPVSAGALVERAAEPLAIAFDIVDVTLVRVVDDQASFTGDIAWTAEALENVLKNCMEHTPAGGTVTVRAWEDVLACRIRVEDTGPGIAEEDLPHIFERFYRGAQAAGASEVNPAGVGIGLSLARSLVVAQGGTLTAENARDDHGNITGARFDLVFFKAVV